MLVVCNGMGRSGSTLQFNWARVLVVMAGVGEAHGYIATTPNHTRGEPHEVVAEWGRDDAYHVAKLHGVHPVLPQLLQEDAARVCYIHRDLRDVAVSMISTWGWRREALADGLAKEVRNYAALESLRQATPERFIWQRYEDVMADPAASVREVADLLGLPFDDEAVLRVVSACSLDTAKAVCAVGRKALREKVREELAAGGASQAARALAEMGRGQQNPTSLMVDRNTQLMYNHISRHEGRSGVWRDALPKPELDMIMDTYGEWLEGAGYDV